MNSQRAVVAPDGVGADPVGADPVGADPVGADPVAVVGCAADSTLGADLQDQVVQQLFAIGLALQSTHRKEQSPEQALRISAHIDQLHDVLEKIRKPAG